MKKKVSIITPVFNEEENIDAYYDRMIQVFSTLPDYDFEIIFTDNCSSDRSFEKIKHLAINDSRIKCFSFSKNFGYQKSILTGYTKATGDAAIEFDCDLQDPPELLPQFLELWRAGNKIVYGIRTQRQEHFFVNILRKIFYRIIRRISENDLPNDAGDFMLIDRKILDQLKMVKDQNLYLRGLIFSFGFRRAGITYSRDARIRGTSKFPFKKMLSLAIDGIISQSVTPLRISSFLGMMIAICTVVLSAYFLLLKFFSNMPLPAGFTTTVMLILFSISLNAIFLGIIGEYLARIYIQTKKRPMTIIDKEI